MDNSPTCNGGRCEVCNSDKSRSEMQTGVAVDFGMHGTATMYLCPSCLKDRTARKTAEALANRARAAARLELARLDVLLRHRLPTAAENETRRKLVAAIATVAKHG